MSVATEEIEDTKVKVRHYRVLAGSHYQNGVLHKKGSIVTTKDRLDKAFLNKFEEVHDTRFVPMRDKKEPVEVSMPAHKTSLGKDITDRYEAAEDAGLKVYLKGGVCNVVDPDEPGIPVNGDIVLKKTQVAKFLKKYLKK